MISHDKASNDLTFFFFILKIFFRCCFEFGMIKASYYVS